MQKGKSVLVAGAGIVGMSCAIWAQRAGFSVTLIDRKGPAAETSFGNAGILASAGLVPVNTPGILWKAIKMAISPRSPLFLSWRHLPQQLGFLLPFLRHATPQGVDDYAQAMSLLISDSHAQHLALSKGTKAARFVKDADWCFAYEKESDLEKDGYDWQLRRRHGVRFETEDNRTFSKADPIFADKFAKVVRCFDQGRIDDPGAYIAALFEHFLEIGGTFERAEITGISAETEDSPLLETDQGPIGADHVVICLGAWSKPVAQKLGLRMPLISERGYHVEFHKPSEMPRSTLMVTSGKFGLTPMRGRIRCAGTVELSHIDAKPNPMATRLIEEKARHVLDQIEFGEMTTWLGHRPSLPDSLPVIGSARGVHLAFGHQHLGLTGGPKTGQIIADMLGGKKTNMDLGPYAPDRF